jgi:hypothetical protein
MIRPRTGDFLYSDDELRVILGDIRVFKDLGVRGIVVGTLTKDGRVNLEQLKRCVLFLGLSETDATPCIITVLSTKHYHWKVGICCPTQTSLTYYYTSLLSSCF